MKFAALLLAAVLPLAAQMASRAAAAPATLGAAPAQPRVPISMLYAIERTCDDKLRAIGEPNTVDMLGATRGVYLEGYGAVFTAEIGLVTPPAIYPFHPTATAEDKVNIRRKMIERLPLLRKAIAEMARSAAASLAAVPEAQQIVVAVRLDYMKWEDTSGLPAMILMKADRKSALAGTFTIDEQ